MISYFVQEFEHVALVVQSVGDDSNDDFAAEERRSFFGLVAGHPDAAPAAANAAMVVQGQCRMVNHKLVIRPPI